MPNRDEHNWFDEFLAAKGIIPPDLVRECRRVHARMDKRAATIGPAHRECDRFHDETGIRGWLDNLYCQGASQQKLTGYVRTALGHEALDAVSSDYPDEDAGFRFRRAWDRMRRNGLHRTYYKPSDDARYRCG